MITQNQIEHILHKQHIMEDLKQSLIEDIPEYVDKAVEIYAEWLEDVKWESHERRKDAIRFHDKQSIVMKILTSITMYCQNMMTFVSISSMINLSDELEKLDSVQLTGDLIALLEPVGLYELRRNLSGTITVHSFVEPNEGILRRINIACYIPPMVSKPKTLVNNDDSGYLTINKDSLFCKDRANFHTGNIGLDVLNKQNAIEFELDNHITSEVKKWHREILSEGELVALPLDEQEIYKAELITRELYLEQFNYLKTLIENRTIYFTNKVDKRGRIYVQGYHFSPQGTDYDKACLNLKHKELITGEL